MGAIEVPRRRLSWRSKIPAKWREFPGGGRVRRGMRAKGSKVLVLRTHKFPSSRQRKPRALLTHRSTRVLRVLPKINASVRERICKGKRRFIFERESRRDHHPIGAA